jgi:predicted outer membrane repeat protein
VKLRFVPILSLLSLFVSVAANADSTVTACSTDVQTGAGTNLSQALQAGGNIYFKCPRPSTIYLTQTYHIKAETLIWGGDAIVLNGAGFIIVKKASTKGIGVWINGNVHFEHITLSHFALPHLSNYGSINAGALMVSPAGSLFLDHVTITDSDTPVGSLGSLSITGSTFQNNTGIAVVSQGTALSIQYTGFSSNATAVFMAGGTIVGSAFTSNSAGAVIVEYPRFDVQIRDSNFQSNSGASAILMSQLNASGGGANVVLRRNTFDGNDGDHFAGAVSIYNPGSPAVFASGRPQRDPKINPFYARLPPTSFDFEFDTFTNNKSEGGSGTQLAGGALGLDLHQTAGALVRGGLFTGNVSATQGGAIASTGGALSIEQGYFKQNRASAGAAVFSESNEGSILMANALVIENSAVGAALDLGAASLANVTIAHNSALGLRHSGTGSFSVSNSILDANVPGNCQSVPVGSMQIANLQFGATDCPGVAVVDPQLDAMYVPGFSSAAIGHADLKVCRTSPVLGKDLVFQLRDHPNGCTIGAYERPPIRLVPRKPNPQFRS